MKRSSHIFEKICTIENIHLAFYKAAKQKRTSKSYLTFRTNCEQKLNEVRCSLSQGTYTPGAYKTITITDPKQRIISIAPFSDRIVHHAIMNVLEPLFERQMICHTYACRKHKGTHRAARYAFQKAHGSEWFLKLDVKKYFDSISHEVLKRHLFRIIKCERTLALLCTIIDSYTAPLSADSSDACTRGLPIGNLTSQFFANLYLSPLDHFVVEKLHPNGYVRYMDDMILFFASREAAKNALCAIECFCATVLNLQFNAPTVAQTKCGIPFLGWRILPHRVALLQKTKRRMKRTLHRIQTDWERGTISDDTAFMKAMCVTSCRKIQTV
ncbi:MAG: group II intron reverse transcriptase domain-containing protein [Treponema sp.]|nr:group II intron reverse transcriptase domain-containing protein [Treponema sp.]